MEKKKKKRITRYLIARQGEPRYTGLTKEELDTLMEKGSVKCGEDLVVAQEGDEIVQIQMVERYEVSKEGDSCHLKPTET